MKVFKFGGSSVKDATAMKKVAAILEGDLSCSLVAISATQYTTNELETIGEKSVVSIDGAISIWKGTLDRHIQIVKNLDLSISFQNLNKEVLSLINEIHDSQNITKEKMDQLYSIGERLSTLILSTYLDHRLDRKVFLKDAREVLITSDEFSRATPLYNEIKNNIWSIESGDLVITQGFIGSTKDGRTTTLGREGSDFSATILAEALNFSEVVIWTDVCGVATMDPRVIKEAKYISEMSYSQAGLLAQLGAKVLFERTLEPASRCNFKVVVKSTNQPNQNGTSITSNSNNLSLLGMATDEGVISVVGNNLDKADLLKHLSFEYELIKKTNEYTSIKVSKILESETLNLIHSLILKCHQSE